MFVAGDIANAETIAAAANIPSAMVCLKQLEPVAMASPSPGDDGLLVVGMRKLALKQAVYGGCGNILAPVLLEDIGKAAGPFGIALPF
jgi:hypothetical protein